MPRKWSNSGGGNGGASIKHRFVEDSPVASVNHKGFVVDLRFVDSILASNARIASKEKRK